jgi:hypothetical protein
MYKKMMNSQKNADIRVAQSNPVKAASEHCGLESGKSRLAKPTGLGFHRGVPQDHSECAITLNWPMTALHVLPLPGPWGRVSQTGLERREKACRPKIS